MSSTDRAAGTAVSHSDRSGPSTPTASSVPSTATATKFTDDLMMKNATDRRAIRSPGIPLRCSTQAPSASPLAPDAGTSDPTASSAQPICQLRFQPIRRQNTGRNMTTYETHDSNSSTTATASHTGSARANVDRSSSEPRREHHDERDHRDPERRASRGCGAAATAPARREARHRPSP